MMNRLKRAKISTIVYDSKGRKRRKFTVLKRVDNRNVNGQGNRSQEFTVPSQSQNERFDSAADAPICHVRNPPKDVFRKSNRFVNWQKVSEQLHVSFADNCTMKINAKCVNCAEHNRETLAIIRCFECGPNQLFCMECAKTIHDKRNQFHVMDIWQENTFIPLYPDHGVLSYGHECPTKIKKPFTIVDFYGRQHVKFVEVCSCESHAATLVRLNLWPGSPDKPTVAFHMELMRFCEKNFLQCQVSLYDFVEVLKALRSPLHPTFVSSVYNILNSGCFEEFRQFQYQCEFLAQKCPDLDDGSKCPLCPEDNGTLIECMDACMGLARKIRKGSQQTGQMRHTSLFFSDQEGVDSFVDNYTSHEPKDIEKDCNRFHAGEVLTSMRSKGKNKLFDEKGVFGRVCRHDYPKGFLNLKYGERISYSVYELKKLKSLAAGKNLSVVVMYDIACILDKHLQGSNQNSLLDNVGLAIPIFHCYGHKASCQVKYSPRRLQGVGLTDGEGVERLWSFLRDFSRMTKEMSADKRTDVLTDALLYYGKMLRGKFGASLKRKLTRAEVLLKDTEDKIEEIVKSFPVPFDVEQVKKWQSEELDTISPREKVLELNWKENYVELLLQNKNISASVVYATSEDPENLENLQKKKARNEKALVAMEKKQKINCRWKEEDLTFQTVKLQLLEKKKESLKLKMQRMASERLFLLEMKKKYADGQAIAIKLSKQISRVSDQLKKAMESYSSWGECLTFEKAKDPCDHLYSSCSTQVITTSDTAIPQSTKKKMVDLMCLKERCQEEVDLVKKEMIQLLSFHLDQINAIDRYTETLCGAGSDRGLKSVLYAKKLALQSCGSHLQEMWKNLKVSPYNWETVTTWMTSSTVPLPSCTDEIDDNQSDSDEDQYSDNDEELINSDDDE